MTLTFDTRIIKFLVMESTLYMYEIIR